MWDSDLWSQAGAPALKCHFQSSAPPPLVWAASWTDNWLRVETMQHETGSVQESEKSFLLAESRTSSQDEESQISMPRAHSRSIPPKAKGTLQVSADTPAQSSSDQQSVDPQKRLKGLGLAGIATVFQSIMSVCAKVLGKPPYIPLISTSACTLLQHLCTFLSLQALVQWSKQSWVSVPMS